MIEKIKRFVHTKAFHVSILIFIVVMILFASGFVVLRYQVEGESNMPFSLTKITVISTGEGRDKQVEGFRWAFDVSQNNDIYLYIEKNQNNSKQEVIKSILIDDLQVQKQVEKGTVKLYKPADSEDATVFVNEEDKEIQSIEYQGDLQSDLKKQKVGNQGGIIAFRYANNNLAELTSNDEVINHNELLKKANINEEDLKATLSFRITIALESGKEYQANVSLDMPIEGVVENGTSSREITDLSDVVFKRIKN